ncbi:MAG: TetR/AcrR family transcriptional regulator [Stenotrophobium sp.]
MPRPQLSTDALDAMRQRLVSAALDLYRSEGLDAISLRRIADATGISHTLPYRYFEHKEALLAALRAECTQRFERFVRECEDLASPPVPRMRAVAAAYIEFVREYPDEYQLMFSTHQPPPDQYPELLAARRSLFDHAVELVQAGIDGGDLTGDARTIAHLFWVSLHGLMTLYVGGQLVHGRSLEDLAEPLVARMLGQELMTHLPVPRRAVVALAPRRRKSTT